ncbi:MAG: M48 family metallopeptidase [Comamonadaceae bacterium]|nr:M48 family metallopeptidase [Comamonadaceae bacterium]
MTTPMPMPLPLQGQWFDGRSTRAQPVRLGLQATPEGPALWLQPEGQPALRLAPHEVTWPERWHARHAPPALVIDLRQHGSLQVDDPAAWHAALAAAGARPTLAERMQLHAPLLLGALLLAAAALWIFYRFGTPWVASQLTRHVPLAWEQSMARQALARLDESHFKPSKLAPARQAELRGRFAALAAAVQGQASLQPYRGYAPPLALEFRSGMGPNAFALPGGAIVMTDALVEKARTVPGAGDAALLGVLAHEIGHVAHRHVTRMVVEQGVLNVGLGLALGDVPTLTASGAALLTGLSYSRSHERQADCYAMALMRARQLPTAPMSALLLALDTHTGGPPGADWLSTHPDTADRAARLRTGDMQGCPPL